MWANTLPRHFCRGPANHNPFEFLSSFYTFYMFYTAISGVLHVRFLSAVALKSIICRANHHRLLFHKVSRVGAQDIGT